MKIKLSDFVANYLVENNIRTNFTVPGGGAMHLNVSFGNNENINNVFVQHEQAAAIAAEAYYRKNNELPLVCCTTGPGGTNTLTGVLGAWLDSIPMLVISGQVKYSMTVRSTYMPFRIYGDQEYDITKTVANMTKYSVMVTEPLTIKYHLDKAIYLSMHGRKGPVWLDIPQNVQSAIIETDELLQFSESEMVNYSKNNISDKTISLIIEKLKAAQRPVIHSGVEIRTDDCYELFRKVIERLNVPVVTSFDGIDILEDDHPLYVGRAGDVGNRYGNWAVQNSDFLLVLGNRLGVRQVGYTPESWARAAFVVMVYNDSVEISESRAHIELPVKCDLKVFLSKLLDVKENITFENDEWISICNKWKKEYPVVDKKRHYKPGMINPYRFIDELSDLLKPGTCIVSANGTACVVGANALKLKEGQRFIINSGCASMGYDLPASIGASFATNKGEVICLAGDGSIQMNLQELQTIVFHNLPIKIIVINNAGYHSMRLTQNNLFPEFKKIGVGPESNDLSFPDMKKIANAYDIPYYSSDDNDSFGPALKEFLAEKSFALLEIFVDITQPFEPKPSAQRLPDGTLISPPMEDMAPFLDREELEKIMIIPLLK